MKQATTVASRSCASGTSEVVQYDDNGRIVSVHPLRFEGTEFDVRTKRGLFSVSIYPVAFRRIDEQPPRG
jgi:hypothetical protein